MVNDSDAAFLHLDVMDGVFVPNISFGFPVIEAIAPLCKKPLDVHLMTVHPEQYIETLQRLGATFVNVHYEACTHLHRTLHAIREAGMRPAVTINPATPVEVLRDTIGDVDMVLLMSVNPGFGGQAFIEQTFSKITRLKELIAETGNEVLIEVDGGVNAKTAPLLAQAGVDVLVTGSYVFDSADPKRVISELAAL